MSSTKSFINTFMLAIATLAITSCVPKATEKKAACGVNQAFSSVSRSCYSIEELRVKPVGTTTTVAMNEEIHKTITLAYTDGNKDKAVSCKVTPTSTNLEMIAPSVADGGLFIKADEIYLNASNIAAELGGPLVASEVAMRTALDKAKASQYYPTVAAQLVVFKEEAASIIAAGAGITNNVVVLSNYMTGQERMLVFTPMMTNMSNRCECTGGVCSTVAIPKLNKTGSVGFYYTVTDVDGEGAAKAVSGTISAMLSPLNSHLKPVATSSQVTFEESLDNTGRTSDFTIADGGDISNTSASAFLYKFKVNGTTYTKAYGSVPDANPAVTSWYGKTPKGYVYGCMDLNATGPSAVTSVATNDRTCKYVPKLGNAWDSLHTVADHPSAFKAIGDALNGYLTFTAKAPGTAGNNISVQYFNLQDENNRASEDSHIVSPEIYGLTGTTDEAFIRVLGNSIKIFINPGVTSSAQIQALVTAHKQANKLVTVVGGSPVSFPSPVLATPSAVLLTGGLAAYDQFPFTVSNAIGDSENDGIVSIRVTRADDTPILGVPGVIQVLEDKAVDPGETRKIVITLNATDNDTDGVDYTNSCAIDMSTPDLHSAKIFSDYFNTVTAQCTCSGSVCKVELDPFVDVSRDVLQPFNFNYTITSTDNTKIPAVSTSTAPGSYQIKIKPVNDEPQISTAVMPSSVAIGTQTIAEGTSGYVEFYIGAGGGGYETDQEATLAVTASVSSVSSPTLLPIGNIVIGSSIPNVAGRKRVTFTPVSNKSGTSTIKLTLKDLGGTADGGDDEKDMSFDVVVTPVNNKPFFTSSTAEPLVTIIETNEGGAVQSNSFRIDEDEGASSDEDLQSISLVSITSDNHSVLPPSAIRIFYDLNDNGVEDSGESRCALSPVIAGCVGDEVLENVISTGSELHRLYLKLDPVDGISGNANITLTVRDDIDALDPYAATPGYTSLQNSISFSFVVHPIAALHGGWNNISSVGLKTDKNGTPAAAAEIQCNYNTASDANNCNTASGNCTGTTSPNSTVIPEAANVIYWDSSSLRCYRSTAANAFSWVDMNTSCPITRIPTPVTVPPTTPICGGDNCIIAGTPAAVTPGMVGQYLLNGNNNTCYVSTGTAVGDWIPYTPAKVTLAWKQFTMVGSGPDSSVQIAGWNIYRRDAGTDYNFKGGHLKNATSTTTYSIADPSIRTFTDTTAIAGRVYYYVVRPVDNIRSFPTHTPESFSEVRVIASPSNYSFVHRWIVNQEMCNGMNITATTTPNHVDQTKNFRCEYSGPGSVDIGGTDYYDYGKDLLVDTQESGCAYAAAPKCVSNTGCIGIGNPETLGYIAATGDMFYDRSTGSCYINDAGTDQWTLFENSGGLTPAIADKTNSALNAPLTNITKARAIDVCEDRSLPAVTYKDSLGVIVPMTITSSSMLPNKKDYMAYASQKLTATDPEITVMEEGYSLNIQSRCNGSAASGLETAFTDSAIPSTSFIYSLPGTFSSGIRSLYTGSIPWSSSKGTEACVSRFGIQDLYGNVAEWVDDGVTCDADPYSTKICKVTTGGTGSFTATDFGATYYAFDNETGPFAEGGDSIVGHTTLTVALGMADVTMTVRSTSNFPVAGDVMIGADVISYTGKTATTFTGVTGIAGAQPIGASVKLYDDNDDAFLTNWTFGDQFFGASYFNYPLGLPLSSNINQAEFSAYLDWILAIGPSSGITSNKLHEDGIIVNGSVGASKVFAVGGSYLSGNRAGRFSSELIDDTVATRPDVGFRCQVPVLKTNYPVDTQHTYPY